MAPHRGVEAQGRPRPRTSPDVLFLQGEYIQMTTKLYKSDGTIEIRLFFFRSGDLSVKSLKLILVGKEA